MTALANLAHTTSDMFILENETNFHTHTSERIVIIYSCYNAFVNFIIILHYLSWISHFLINKINII
jgi:hypothetical protein